ncbi:MAG: SDR family oxidoreductase [Pseudomonadota bacterium]
MKKILILGASSDIARASALSFLHDGWEVALAGRDICTLYDIAQDLKIRSNAVADIDCYELDVNNKETFSSLWQSLDQLPDAVLCAVGYLGNQDKARYDDSEATKILSTNFTSLVPILSQVAADFEKRKSGLIIGISSVAGDRGRASNYTYGAAKAGFTAYLSGLRNRLAKDNVHVITVNPGFVATRMTEDLQLPAVLTASPKDVAQDIMKAVHKKRNVIYTKWFWRYIMLCVCAVPECIFKKLKF